MPIFWRKQKKQPQKTNQSMTIMESDSLGMTVVQQDFQNEGTILQLSPQEWVLVIHNKNLTGFPFQRIYFSFLKGIPDYLRFKIWLFFCTENNSKDFKITSKMQQTLRIQLNQKIKLMNIKEFTLQIFQKLSALEPKDKQKDQIQKDIHRSYSNKPQYKYTAPLLRKILYTLSNSGVEYAQGMNYILLNVIIFCLQSIGITNEAVFTAVNLNVQKDIFIILRQIVIRMDQVFGNNNIFKVIADLEEKIAQTVPEILFYIYKMGLDCFSMFSQNYFALMSYNDPPEEMCKQMMDLFFLVGQKAIHSIIVRMLQRYKTKILSIQTPQQMQKYLKIQIFKQYSKQMLQERKTAKKLQDFGLSFYSNVQHF